MAYELSPITPPDYLAVAALERAAFAQEPLSMLMFGPSSDAALQARADKYADISADPSARWLKVVLDGQIVGAALWGHRTTPAWMDTVSAGEKANPYTEEESGLPQSGRKLREAFFGWLYDVRRRHMGGRPHILLNLLVVHPDYQRRGIGRALMRQGLEEGDRLGLPVWLEASAEGLPLYRSEGFELVETMDLDLKEYGGAGVVSSCAMQRSR